MLWIKALHIIFVTSWFAGLFYLPRIYVNLAMETDPQAQARLLLMAHKLNRFMQPLMWLALAFGLWLWLVYGIGGGWLHAKLALVIALIGYHHYCGRLLKQFRAQQNRRSHVWFRWFNEVPVLILTVVVILVTVKPF
ncbi:CopD family protein [Methylophilus medardicus]|uniref:Protoporphyrinogen IX oxidase n=1 Tax=Methylophilus medardicus TaxID=2588534 RepID=A0A5B8CTY7_9PROT|nr:CopD family protein [Methylophilus medardicus]QDC44752.1 CopD family protein [Methylophilus medardicus]QDC49759.1 CopD family protein [Methylophilus medardicus]QDC53464.1 CopD family protein [Methylophilus medardicus]